MPEPKLSVRSAKPRDPAHRLARGEHRSISVIVERAEQVYEARETGREPAPAFYARMASGDEEDGVDLNVLIRADRQKNVGPDL